MKQIIFVILFMLFSFLKDQFPNTSDYFYFCVGRTFMTLMFIYGVYAISSLVYDVIKDKLKK
jgi:hypothetical protein